MTGPLERGIYLASRSPRRRDLLSQIGVRYHLLPFRTRPGEGPDLDETPLDGESPGAYVERVARAKAESGWQRMMQRNLPHHALPRSEEHTSELQSRLHLVCRLLLEKKNEKLNEASNSALRTIQIATTLAIAHVCD